jgi:hypothetical protein
MATATLLREASQPRTSRPAVVAGRTVDAIAIPAGFAELVQAELGIMMLAGPVAATPEGSWVFLTQPANTGSPAVPADLLPLGVRLVPAGTRVELPDASGRSGSWVTPPAPNRPPAIWSTVIGAARRVAQRNRAARRCA